MQRNQARPWLLTGKSHVATAQIVNSTLSNCLAKMNLDMAMGKNATGFEDWVIKQLNGNISSLINSSVCGLLANVAEKDLGGGLKNLSMALEPYMAPITPQPPEHVPDLSDVLDLEQTPVITYLNYMASIALGPEKLDELIDFMLPKGWVGASGVNGLNVSVPLASFSNTTLPYGLGNLTVVAGVSGFNITGLSSFNGLTLFEAVGPQTLRSAIGLESVTVRLTGFLELLSAERANREPLVEWLDIFIRVDNVTLTQLTQVCHKSVCFELTLVAADHVLFLRMCRWWPLRMSCNRCEVEKNLILAVSPPRSRSGTPRSSITNHQCQKRRM